MKKLLIALLMLYGVAHAQVENRIKQYVFTERLGVGRAGNNDSSVYFQVGPNSGGSRGFGNPRLSNIGALIGSPIPGLQFYDNSIKRLKYWAEDRWITIDSSAGGSPYDSTIDLSAPVTTNIPGLKGSVLGVTDIKAALEAILYQSEDPTLSLTGGIAQEFMAAGANVSQTVNYTAGRQAATEPLDSIRIDGTYKSFSQPAKPGTVSGTHSVSIPRNVNTTISGYVRTTDSKVTSASTTFTWNAPRYVLWLTDTTGISSGAKDSDIIAGTKDVSSARAKTYNTGAPSGTQYPVFVYIATAGALTTLKMNGFESIGAWKTVTKNITTGAGYVGSFRIYWGNNGQTSASNIEAQ